VQKPDSATSAGPAKKLNASPVSPAGEPDQRRRRTLSGHAVNAADTLVLTQMARTVHKRTVISGPQSSAALSFERVWLDARERLTSRLAQAIGSLG
jgi:hypothetical protein